MDEKGQSPALDYANDMPESHIGKLMHLFEVMGDIGKIHDITKFRNEADKIYAYTMDIII